MAIEKYGSDKRRYTIEVTQGDYSYMRESFIHVGDQQPILSAGRVVEKILRQLATRGIDREDIIVRVTKERS